jgi:hypothetical protein
MKLDKRLYVVTAAMAAAPLVFGACGGEIRAERHGKQLGDAICDVKSSDDADEAQRQLRDVDRELDQLQRIVGRPIAEDVDDIDENLSDLVQHVADGNDALVQQDIAVIQRNVDAVTRGLTGKAEAAYDGVLEGLADCDY